MASKIWICKFVCLTLLVVQNSVARSLAPKCDYACKEQDLDTGDGYFASGSAISSQFLAPDGSVVTNSKETSISSDGIKQTFHELKKEADRFVQTGQGGPAVHPHLQTFGNIPNIVPPLPNFPVHGVPYVSSGHDSYSQSTKDRELAQKLIYKLSPSTSSYHSQLQTQNSAHIHPNSQITCDVCASQVGSGHSENTASYNAIIGNVAPASEAHSSYQKYESSAQKNSTYQTQPIPFSNSLKPNTFTTTFIDLNGANKNIQNGAGSESHVSYHQEQGSSQTKSEERFVNGGGPVAYPSRVVVGVVNEPSLANSHSFEKQQSSTHVQTGNHPYATDLVQQAETELAKQHQNNAFLSPILLGGVPQPVRIDQHPSSYQSSHSYYSSSSSKSVGSSDSSSPIVLHQSPQKYSASNGYSSSSSSSGSSSSSSNGVSYAQHNVPEVYYNHGNKLQGVSSSIYDHQVRGDQIQSNPNAETLCTVCSYAPAGSPAVKTYGVATSYASQSSTINGKTTENREAAVVVDDNGKVDKYHVKT